MKIKFLLLSCILILLNFTSCDILMQVANEAMRTETPLSTEQVAQGLKQALQIGAETAVKQLNTTNGYYHNQALKINLPPETQQILENAKRIPGVEALLEQLVLQLNRSAEDAAIQAKPILTSAITTMSIADAWEILQGEEDAATQYLKSKTFNNLTSLYQPSVKKSLDKPLVAGISANQSWQEISNKWNTFAKSLVGKVINAKTLDYSLDQYVTREALKGLFYMIEGKEKEIRTDINARTTDLLRKVFNQQSE